jgi:DNA-binding response OmpR family regulator
MKILIVDDRANLARVTALALQGLGCETRQALSIREANENLATENFDSVFLDVNLGEESGFEFLSVLVGRWKDLPVIMFSAQTREEIADEAFRRGAFDCIIKPFGIEDLRNVLQNLRARVSDKTPPARST